MGDNHSPSGLLSKPRKCGPRVKTGCITCKVRHVKCGEEKPYCQRCISTGRKCDGYTSVQPRRQKQPSNWLFYRPVYDASSTELLCYWSTSRITRFFGPESLWKHSLPHLALSEPAIQYALVALRSAEEAFCQRSDKGKEKFALRAYNRAIQHLVRKYSPHSSRDIHVVLVVCALFVCLELVRGDVKVAIKHIRAGLKILQHQGYLKDDRLYPRLNGSMAGILFDLVDLFSRLRIQSLTFDLSLIPEDYCYADFIMPQWNEEQYFHTLAEARSVIFELYTGSTAVIQEATVTASHDLDLIISQHKIMRQVTFFNRAFDTLMLERGPTWSREETKLANVTKLQTLVIQIYTGTCLFRHQSALDAYEPEFEQMVNIAEKYVESSLIDSFQMDWGIIPLVHFAGVKCRNPRLRRRILQLLSRRQWREGCYDSFTSYRVVYRQMSIEEAGIDLKQRPHALPGEEVRIHNSLLNTLLEQSAGTMCYSISMITFPNGLNQLPVLRQEYIPASGPLPLYEKLD